MKIKIGIFRLLILTCGTFAIASAFGQTTYVWTNQNPAHLAGTGDMNQATNWDPNGVPNPMTGPDANNVFGDECQFDGRTTGPLAVTQNGGVQTAGAGALVPYGLRLHLSSNQTSSVTIYSPVTVSGGMRMNSFTIDAGAGALILGDHITGNCLDILAGALNGQILGFTNNSSAPCVINESVRWRLGGGGGHPFVFDGTGDWIINNHMRSANLSAILVQKFGSGTMTWTGTNNANANYPDQLGSPITIGGGTMILKSSDLLTAAAGGPAIVHNGVLLKYDCTPAPGIVTSPAAIAGNISGTGAFQVNAGTLTLSGASTFTGNITLSGGELITGSAENVGVSGPLGQGGIISFNGGTLGFSTNNNFDYSPRFSTAAGQAYRIDTAGQNVTFATELSSSGSSLTKTNPGTLTMAGTSSYSGLTIVSAGKLVFQGSKTGFGDITVADGATLGVFDTGTPVSPNTLTLGTSGSTTLEFDNVNSTTTAPLAAVNLSSAGTITINVNSGTFPTVGLSYPLLAWTSGSAPAVSLGIVNGAVGSLSTNGNTIQLNITTTAYQWTGLNNSCWDTITTSNWTQNGFPAVFVPNNGPVLFDDTAPGTTSVTVCAPVQPASITVNNSVKAYTIASSGGNNIAGGTGLTKSSAGTLTLSGGANTYTGVTTINGGTMVVGTLANGGVASDIGAANNNAANLVLNGGTLQYTGGAASIDRLFTVGFNGGTIDSSGSGALTLNNPGPISLNGNLTLSGNNTDTNTLAVALFNSGTLIKSGTGLWILTGTNSHGGGTVVNDGVLQIGATLQFGGNSGSGSLGFGNVSIGSGTTLDFWRTGTLTVPGVVSGNGAVTVNGSGTVVLANNNTYTGGTTIIAGTLQVGNGGSTGSLNSSSPIFNDSLLVFNTSGSFYYGAGGIISGTGNVILQGGGFIKAVGNNSYTGWTRIDANTTFQPIEGQDGALVSSAVTNNGTLRLVTQLATFVYPGPIVGTGRVLIGANAFSFGVITLTGTNTYSGGTFIGGITLVLGDGVTPISGSIAGNVRFTNNIVPNDTPRTLTFNRPDDFTFSGTITTNFASPQANLGVVQQNGSGRLTLTGNNTYGSGTVINAGAMVVGNGGTNGSLGYGPVALNSGNPLVINRSGNLSIPSAVTGIGGVTLIGSATVTLSSAGNTYSGPTTVSNGTLVVTSLGGDLNVEGGTVVVQDTAVAAKLNVPGDMKIDSGTVVATLNKAAAQSNTTYSVSGSVIYTGGTLKLLTVGPALMVGDKFFIFNRPVTGGAAMPIFSPGYTVANNLAVDGSMTVASAQSLPIALAYAVVSGTNLVLSWPSAWQGGVYVQSQTNSITNGLRNNWVTILGTDAFNSYTNTISKSSGTVFFRLVSP